MRVFIMAGLFCVASVAAWADTVYEVNGTFGSDLVGSTGLAGGTFTGTFEAAGFPLAANASGTIDSYSFTLYDSSGDVEYLFSGDDNTSQLQDINGQFVATRFGDGGAGAGVGLNFAEGFTGTGAALPFNRSTLPYASGFEDPDGDIVAVASAEIAPVPATTPEPSSIGLVSGGIALSLGFRRRLKF